MEMEEKPYGHSLRLPDRSWNEMWRLIDKKNNGHVEICDIAEVFKAYEVQQYNQSIQDHLELLFGEEEDFHDNDVIAKMIIKTKWAYTPYYELGTNLFSTLNGLSIAVRDIFSYNPGIIYAWVGIQIFINFVFLVEVLIDLFTATSAKSAYSGQFRLWPETVCQILNIYAIGFFILYTTGDVSYLKVLKYFEAIIFMRMMKFLPLVYELSLMRVIIETLRNLMVPLAGLLIIVLCIFYMFAIIGMFLFGGKVELDTPAIINDSSLPPDFVLMNFNDILSSFVTQYALVIVNNWYVIVDANTNAAGSAWFRLYFLVFYYFGVLVGVNILVSFAIDMYSAVSRLDDISTSNERFLLALARKYEKRIAREKKLKNKVQETKDEQIIADSNNLLDA